MFYPEKITLIKPGEKVLEIGPGSSPHPRSNAFLELDFASSEDKLAQRGWVREEGDFNGRPMHYYGGGELPFENNEFDYVICSHVVEHVDNPEAFLQEIFRVGKGRGYIEYPLITYEYLYNFDVHLQFVKFDFQNHVLSYIPKNETHFKEFAGVNALFYKTLECGWNDLCVHNKALFFEGVEFARPFVIEKATGLQKLLPPKSIISEKSPARKFLDRIAAKLGI